MDVEPRTIPAYLRHRGVHDAGAAALIHDDESISHRELDERRRALAARLVAAGVGKRSRVGMLMPNESTGRRSPTRPCVWGGPRRSAPWKPPG
jgi:acyl-CoA synthetase (AMP-forming)/AMP-acid ligase II